MIKRAKSGDIEQIFNISNCYFDWSQNQLKDCLKDDSIIFLVHEGNGVEGFLIAQNLVDSYNILLIATKKECQNKKIGSALVKELEKIVKAQQIEKIWLEVKESNLQAIKFYEKLNFKFLAKRKHYYKTGEDALIYEKSTI